MKDLLIVSHISLDYITTPASHQMRVLGGPPYYTGFTARSFNLEVSIASKIGKDFPEEYMQEFKRAGLDVKYVKKTLLAGTTSYWIIYPEKGERSLIVTGTCLPIKPEELPEEQFKCIHVSPICSELPKATMDAITSRRGSLLILDPQGFTRSFSYDGIAYSMAWGGIVEELSKFHVVKASEAEWLTLFSCSSVREALEASWRKGVSCAIATRGSRGVYAMIEGSLYDIPAFPVEAQHTTGAGDVFVGCLVPSLIKGEDVLWAISLACAGTSLFLEGIPLLQIGQMENSMEERARKIHNSIKRL
ncbi:MAG TPA: carbohydrate kinase family protein [Candidatus Methanomethylia archaeon]|nr:carbohydrate kinase family protein [Candidatus Verstraetearchaeota archaeon]HDI47173.1 carbohydrate kinase family protein [Candidatus Methanomethylicia archaeon]